MREQGESERDRATGRGKERVRGTDRERELREGEGEEEERRPVWRGVSGFCGRQMTVAYLPGPAAILLRSDLRRRPPEHRGKKERAQDAIEAMDVGLRSN